VLARQDEYLDHALYDLLKTYAREIEEAYNRRELDNR